jgi:PIN domain nuclease of toxin-antitoxin system
VRLLFDTHALLWWLADDDRLGARARGLVEDPVNDVIVSAVSLWEIVVKARIGKLQADIEEIADTIQREGFTPLAITTAHLRTLAELPIHHRDPFDHLLIAQAIVENATFISEDRNTHHYPIQLVTCTDSPNLGQSAPPSR